MMPEKELDDDNRSVPDFDEIAQRVPHNPDLASLRGAAGSLKEPLPWDEVLEIAREDHLVRGIRTGNELSLSEN